MKQSLPLPSLLLVAAFVSLALLPDTAEAQRNRRGRDRGNGWKFVAEKYDADKDGTVTVEEYTRGEEALKTLDGNGDGVLDESDWKSQSSGPGRGRGRGRGHSDEDSADVPKVGDVAPDFSLTEIKDAEKQITLSEFAGKQPVALIFGSCT